MRETCARVLAAALMTGAIAFAVGMPALFGTAHELGRSVLAPPSSLQRTIRTPGFPAQPRGAGPERVVDTSPAGAQRTEPARFELARSSPRQRRPRGGKPAPAPKPNPAPQPKPTPGVQVGTRELASTAAGPTRAVDQGATTRAAGRDTQHLGTTGTKAKGKAKGHERGNGNHPAPAADTAQPTSTTTSPPAAAAPAPTSDQSQPDASHDNGQGHDNGNGGGNGGGEGNPHDGGNGNGQAKGHGD
jgi:hypothetical protein